MPYSIGWYIDKQVVFVHYRIASTPEELHGLLLELNHYASECEHPLMHVIADVTEVKMASNLMALALAIRNYTPDPKIGWVITVGAQNMMVRFSANITRQILRLRQRSYDTIAEAVTFLRDMDSAIDWEKADERILIHQSGDGENPPQL